MGGVCARVGFWCVGTKVKRKKVGQAEPRAAACGPVCLPLLLFCPAGTAAQGPQGGPEVLKTGKLLT